MAVQSTLLKLGARLGTLGSSSSVAFAYPLVEGGYDPAAHTDTTRIGQYADRTGGSEKVGVVVMGTEVLTIGVSSLSTPNQFTSKNIQVGTGTPEGAVTAAVGTIFQRTDGASGTTLYVKSSGSGNTGWLPMQNGTVTSVGLVLPSIFTVINSPVTSSGTLAASLINQSGNTVFAAPSNGLAGSPLFRNLVTADFPTTAVTAGSYGAAGSVGTFTVDATGRLTAAATVSIAIAASQVTSGQLTTVRGGTGIDTSAAANGQLLIGNGGGLTLATLTAGTGITVTNGSGTITIAAVNSGTVTSVALALPSIFTVSGSPVTSSGTLTATLATQSANLAWAGPASGVAAAPTFRALVTADLPATSVTAGSYGSASAVGTFTVDATGRLTAAATTSIAIAASQITSGLLSVQRGGTGLDGSAAANGTLLIGNGTGYSSATLTAGTGITVTNGAGTITIAGNVGTVTSVALALPGIFTVSGSPVTGSGTLTGTLATQTANLVWAGPASGVAATPTFRALVTADFPASGVTAGTYGSASTHASVTVDATGRVTAASSVTPSMAASVITSGQLTTARGGTGLDTSAAANGTVLIGNGSGLTLTTLTAGSGVTVTNGSGTITIAATGTGGTVTSVALALPSIFTVSGSPVTTSGTLTGTLATQAANLVWAGPVTGSAAAPTFRSLVTADFPASGVTAGTYGSASTHASVTVDATGRVTAASSITPSMAASVITSGQLATARGGTGLDTSAAANGTLLIGNGAGLTAATLTAGTGITVTNGSGTITIAGNVGTVTSVALALPSIFAVSGSPVTSSGTLTGTLATQAANLVWAGPVTGVAAAPTFRALVTADLPATAVTAGSYGSASSVGTFTVDATGRLTAAATTAIAIAASQVTSGLLATARGGTGVDTSAAANGTLLIGNGSGLTATTLTAGAGITVTNGSGTITIAAINAGTVTSVALALPTIFTVSGSPVTSSGTLTATLATQAANLVWAGPASGVATAPTFRALVTADLPATAVTAGSYGSASAVGTFTVDATGRLTVAATTSIAIAASQVTSGLLAPARGGTGVDTSAAANGTLLIGNGTGLTLATLTAGAGITVTNGSGTITIAAINAGTVTSVALALPSIFTVSGSPVTSSGTLTATLATQTANTIFAAPSGSTGAPTFRALVTADLPTTAVTAGSYGSASAVGTFTVDATGRLTAAATTSISIVASQVSNFDTQVRTSRLDQMATPTAAVSWGSQKITNLADPTNPQDAATKNYVDGVAQGLAVKPSVLVASTANLTLSGEQTIDGFTTSASRVLVKNQTTASQNGIYVTAAGAWTRAVDMSTSTEFSGSFVFVEEGTVNGVTGWVCTNVGSVTIGTTAITFSQFSGAGTYTAGTGLTLTGSVFSVTAGGITGTQLNTTGVTAGTYGSASTHATFTVDVNGRITAASSVTPSMAASVITSGQLTNARGGTGLDTSTAANGTLLIGNGAGLTAATLTAGTGVTIVNGSGTITINATGTGGTVTSVALALPTIFTVSGSPVTTSGTLTATLATQTANLVWAGPASGVAAAPTFRALVTADLPATAVTAASYGSASSVATFTVDATGRLTAAATTAIAIAASQVTSGILANARGGTGLDTSTAANGALLIGNGTGLTAATLTAGSGITVTNGSGTITIAAINAGTVTSVALALPAIFTVSGSPVTSSGTLTATLATQAANLVWAGPASGVAAAPTFRALVTADFPTSGVTAGTYGSASTHASVTVDATGRVTAASSITPAMAASVITSGQLATARGGTGLDTSAAANGSLLVGNGAGLTLATLTAGAGITVTNGSGTITVAAINSGTVTSVALALPSIFTVSGSPVTSSGTLTATLATQTANLVWAGPASGVAAAPTFRALVTADLPATAVTAGSYGSASAVGMFTVDATGRLTAAASTAIAIAASAVTSGQLATARGGTGLDTSAAANGTLLIGNGAGLTAATLTAGAGITVTNGSGTITIAAVNSGTVTSVALALPAIFTVSGSPVTSTGTLTATLATQTANLVWAGPATGVAAAPTFRALVTADFPTSGVTAGTYGSASTHASVTVDATGRVTAASSITPSMAASVITSGQLTNARGGTGLDTSAAANGQLLIGNGTGLTAATLTAGAGITVTNGSGTITIAAINAGTVTSVALALPAIFAVSGSPVTASGTLTATLATQSAATVWAGPATGASAAPTFRTLAFTDLATAFGTQTANTIFAGPVSGGVAAPGFRAIVTADLPATAVTAGSYGSASSVGTFTVDATGRLTAAATTAIAVDASAITTGTLPIARGGTNQTAFTSGQVTFFDGTSLNGNAAHTWDNTNNRLHIQDAGTLSDLTSTLGIYRNTDGYVFTVECPNQTGTPAFSVQNLPLSTDVNTGKAFQIKVTGEANGRIMFYSDGKFGIGGGTAIRDTFISRAAVSTFKITSDGATGVAHMLVSGRLVAGTLTDDGSHALQVTGVGVITGTLGVGVTPTATLHLAAGTATVGTSPLKFTSGTNLGTAEAGAMEWNGTNLFITQTTGPTRKTVAYTDSNITGTATNVTGVVAPANGGTGFNASAASNGQLFIGNGAGLSLATLTAGTGITITNGSGTIAVALSNTAVTANSYGSASSVATFTVNSQGQLTAAATTAIAIAASQVTSGQLTAARGGTGLDGSAAANGSLLIGNGTGYTLATLTAGTGITVTNAAGGITVALTASDSFDGTFTISNTTDQTKTFKFSLGGNTTGVGLTLSTAQTTTQTLAIPNVAAGDTLATLNVANTFTATNTFTNSASTLALTQGAAASGTPKIVSVTGGAHTGLTASSEIVDISYNLARIVTHATGAIATQRSLLVQPPTHAFAAASTITDAATVAISGAPVAGTNATITRAYALWVQAGGVRFDGTTAGFFGVAPVVQQTGDIGTGLSNLGLVTSGTLAAASLTGTVSALHGGTGFDGSAAANGRLPIGNGAGFTLANITAGAGITVTNGVGTITIATTAPSVLFASTATSGPANTATSTSIIGAGTGTLTIPANTFTVGKVLRLTINGLFTCPTIGAPTLTIKVVIGSVTYTSTAVATNNGGATTPFSLVCMATCRTTGATGTIQTVIPLFSSNLAMSQFTPGAASTIDTTSAQTISATAQYSGAVATTAFQSTNVVVELMD